MKPLELFLFIDALGWAQVERYHFLEKELPYRGPVEMQFGFSCTAIPTILSGKRPREHGHLTFYYYDPEHSPFRWFRIFRWLPFANSKYAPWNRGRVRHWISRICQKLLGFTGYFQLYNMPFGRLPLFNYCEDRDMFVPGGMSPCRNLADELAASGLRYHISDWRQPEDANLREATDLLRAGNVDFLFVYTAGFDGLQHDSVRSPERVEAHLRHYETAVREMLAVLEKSGRPYRFTIFSDHGMTALAGTADVKHAVECLPLKFGRDYAASYDSTMFRVWFLRPEARSAIQNAVSSRTFPGHYLSAEEKRRYGVDFPDNRYGDEIFLMDPGVQIVPSDMGNRPLNGMHGFAPDDRDSTASILSNAPFPPPGIATVADYFGLMRERIAELREK